MYAVDGHRTQKFAASGLPDYLNENGLTAKQILASS
jgi:hypothetical protein